MSSLPEGHDNDAASSADDVVIFGHLPGSYEVAREDDITSSVIGAVALRYGEMGWDVFPLAGKVPLIPKREGGNGHLDATSDLGQIRAWWTKYPDANIGGRVPAGLVVLDVDPYRRGDQSLEMLIERLGPLPATLTCLSGRGGGSQHRYFRDPGGSLRSRLGHGLDVKTRKGYAVLPPSRHPVTGGEYRWQDPSVPPAGLPEEWAEFLRRQEQPRPSSSQLVGVSSSRYVAAALRYSADRILEAPPRQHSQIVNAVAFGLGRLVASGVLAEPEALAVLTDAAARLCPKNHLSSIRSGLEAGKQRPRRFT